MLSLSRLASRQAKNLFELLQGGIPPKQVLFMSHGLNIGKDIENHFGVLQNFVIFDGEEFLIKIKNFIESKSEEVTICTENTVNGYISALVQETGSRLFRDFNCRKTKAGLQYPKEQQHQQQQQQHHQQLVMSMCEGVGSNSQAQVSHINSAAARSTAQSQHNYPGLMLISSKNSLGLKASKVAANIDSDDDFDGPVQMCTNRVPPTGPLGGLQFLKTTHSQFGPSSSTAQYMSGQLPHQTFGNKSNYMMSFSGSTGNNSPRYPTTIQRPTAPTGNMQQYRPPFIRSSGPPAAPAGGLGVSLHFTSGEKELSEAGINSGENFKNFDKIALQVIGRNPPKSITSFSEAGLCPLLAENIKKAGYVNPTPIQKGAISVILAKRDLIACAVTGSGKTVAYLVPVMTTLLEQGVTPFHGILQKPEVVIVAPTRELAINIHREACKLSYNSALKAVVICGGTVNSLQLFNLQAGCNILVATVGYLKYFLDRGVFDFSCIQFLILEELDRMLDMGFRPYIEKIAAHPTMPPKGVRCTCMFSVTFSKEVQALAAGYMEDYIILKTSVCGTNEDEKQIFYHCGSNVKIFKLMEILNDEVREKKAIVFVESKKTADYVAAILCNYSFQATSIHGDRLQSQRETALREFKQGVRNVLVATNVAARGLDIAGVDFVINYDLPTDLEEYVHRVGRTGLVGNLGRSITLFDEEKDGPNAGKLVSLLTKSNADVPAFLQAMVSGVGGMGYDFNAPSEGSGGFASRDMRRFGDKPGGAARPTEAEESWD